MPTRLACLLALLLAGCMDRSELPGFEAPPLDVSRVIEVEGTGTFWVEPNQSTFEMVVDEEAGTPQLAYERGRVRATNLKQAMERAGVKRAEMRIVNTELRPISPAAPGIAYRMSERILVSVRDLNLLSEVLTKAVESGADRVTNVRFGISNAPVVRARARVKAIADAREKAQTLAEEAGQHVGAVLAISERPTPAPSAADDSDSPFEFVVSVSVTFALSEF